MKNKKRGPIKNSYFIDCHILSHVKILFENPVFLNDVSIMNHTSIGQFTYFGEKCIIGTLKSIGRYCSVAPGVKIGLGNHPKDYLSTHPLFFNSASMFEWFFEKKSQIGINRSFDVVKEEPVIGHDVWIGANSMIARGVKIGNGAIIAANSYVNCDVPDYAIFAGNPAKIIKYRFTEQQIEKLKKLQWWNLQLDFNMQQPCHDIEKMIALLEQNKTIISTEKFHFINGRVKKII